MTLSEAIEELNGMQDGGDNEADHDRADTILSEFLADNGYVELSEAFEAASGRVGFWYA